MDRNKLCENHRWWLRYYYTRKLDLSIYRTYRLYRGLWGVP